MRNTILFFICTNCDFYTDKVALFDRVDDFDHPSSSSQKELILNVDFVMIYIEVQISSKNRNSIQPCKLCQLFVQVICN